MARDVSSSPSAPEYMHATSERQCPQCTGAVYRVQRRLIDRIFHFLAPKQRFRCRNFSCRWEGNLRVEPKPVLETGKKAVR